MSAEREKGPIDRTYLAVRRQLKAMGAEQYEVGIGTKKSMLSRVWSQDEVLKAIPWLKSENSKGNNIYVRPAGDVNRGIILVDDLNKGNIARMKNDGYEPSVVVETSPQNYQAWVRVSKNNIDPDVATFLSKGIAKRYEADPNSADWRHYGRLAGFTNRKPEHVTENGTYPWVLSHESTGKVATKGEAAIAYSITKVAEIREKEEKDRQERLKAAESAIRTTPNGDPVKLYKETMKVLVDRYGDKWKSENVAQNKGKLDYSKLDFMIIRELAKRGFTQKQLEHTLEVASPNLSERKPGTELKYIERTVTEAMKQQKKSEPLQKAPKAELER